MKSLKIEEKVDEWYAEKLRQRTIRNWLIFVKEPVYKQAEVAVDLKSAKIRHFLRNIQANYLDNQEIRLKNLSLSLYLDERHKLTHYYRMKTNVQDIQILRNNKENRLQRLMRAKYFY